MVRDMGTFDDWQAQKDSQYLTLTDYITELAKAENSSIKATLLYLINHKENLKLYKKSIDGNYHKIAYDDLFDCFEDNALDDALKELLTYIEQTPYFHDFNFIGNDFSKKLYKNVYVKKVGVSRIEPVAPSEPKAGEIKPHDEPIELGENQLLMKDYPSFTPHELACFLSDKDPDYINNNNFTDFNLSERLVYKALSNGYLSKNVNEEIKNQEAKEYLHSIGKIYKGFNDNLPPVTADKIGHATITQTMPTDSQLSQQVADQQATIDSQAKEIADLKAQLKPQAAQPSKTPVNNKQLSNVEISNIYGKAIIANNNILAKVIKTLDYRDLITREQIANFINPYMWEMALILSDDDEQKAESLMVTNKTIMDNHLKGVKFKKGAPNKQDKTKPSIDLIINRDELN